MLTGVITEISTSFGSGGTPELTVSGYDGLYPLMVGKKTWPWENSRDSDAARDVAGIADVVITAKADQQLVPLPEGASYLGFIFARAATPAAVEDTLRHAHGCLRFRIESIVPVA